MSEILSSQPQTVDRRPQTLPVPSVPMSVRVGTRDDVPFMDRLQKMHSKALGFFSRKMFEGYIDAGNVLVAWASRPCGITGETCEGSPHQPVPREEPIGYCISRDRYLKRDELGAVFQLCVVPGRERGFIGANLLREVFERSSYGCRLYCCWCAQDLPANRFWEAMGFVPIAYRAGGRGSVRGSQFAVRGEEGAASDPRQTANRKLQTPRIHIFWQKRIRSGDNSTPYWFPAKTEGGAIREDRIILPIPPGMRWWDALPVLLNDLGEASDAGDPQIDDSVGSDEARQRLPATLSPRRKSAAMLTPLKSKSQTLGSVMRFRSAESTVAEPITAKPQKRDLAKRRVKQKADPTLVAKARELRDRWIDHVAANGGDPLAALSSGINFRAAGKYDVSRTLLSASHANRLVA